MANVDELRAARDKAKADFDKAEGDAKKDAEKSFKDAEKAYDEARVQAAAEEGKAKVEVRKAEVFLDDVKADSVEEFENLKDRFFPGRAHRNHDLSEAHDDYTHWTKDGVAGDHETRIGVKSAEELAERRNLK